MFRHLTPSLIRTWFCWLGTGCLTACLFDFGGDADSLETPAIVQPGIYRADYGEDFPTFESELSLGFDGNFRWFAVDGNVALVNQRGKWSVQNGEVIFIQTESSRLIYYPEFFKKFTPSLSDTAPVRNATRDGFAKYEVSPAGGNGNWILYNRASFARLNPGNYVHRDTTFQQLDSLGNLDTMISRREFQFRTGGLESGYQEYFRDTARTDVKIPSWTQMGSFLVFEGNKYRNFVDSLQGFGDWADTEGDWVFRIQNADEFGFQYWDWWANQWLEYRREP